jgi:hypothetical protein
MKRKAAELRQEEQYVQIIFESGLLTKYDIDMNEVWVDPLLWGGIDYDTKYGVAVKLANVCDLSGLTGRINILNNKTGKKLARYS